MFVKSVSPDFSVFKCKMITQFDIHVHVLSVHFYSLQLNYILHHRHDFVPWKTIETFHQVQGQTICTQGELKWIFRLLNHNMSGFSKGKQIGILKKVGRFACLFFIRVFRNKHFLWKQTFKRTSIISKPCITTCTKLSSSLSTLYIPYSSAAPPPPPRLNPSPIPSDPAVEPNILEPGLTTAALGRLLELNSSMRWEHLSWTNGHL